MIKINAQGDTLWTRVGSSAPNHLFNIIQAPDGGILIGGNKSSSNLLSKVDNQGNPQWEHNYYITGESRIILDMMATADGSILCAGILGSTSFTSGALTILKVDSTGNTVWSKQINSLYGTFGYNIATRPDGGFYLFGTQLDTTVTTSGNMYLVSMDSSGAMLWDRLYGFPTENDGYEIITTSDGGALLAGTHGQPEKLYLVKIDSTGNSGCNELTPQTSLNSVVLSDTSYTITVSNPPLTEFPITFTYESGKNYYDACSLIGIAEPTLNSFSIFPNPANNYVTVKLDQKPTDKVSMKLFDITGKLIQSIETINLENNLYLENVSDGIYFLKITVDNKIYGTRKVMVNKSR